MLYVNEMSSHAEYKNTTCQRMGIDIMGIIPCRAYLYYDLGMLIFVVLKDHLRNTYCAGI